MFSRQVNSISCIGSVQVSSGVVKIRGVFDRSEMYAMLAFESPSKAVGKMETSTQTDGGLVLSVVEDVSCKPVLLF